LGISSATVELKLHDRVVAETVTEDDGKFQFSALPRGQYNLTASKAGFLDLMPQSSATTIVSISETGTVGIRISLTRSAAITGALFDDSGLPLRAGKVIAVVRRWSNSGFRLVPANAEATSDDQGIYRLYGLAPGTYTVVLVPSPGENSAVFAPVYFPGVVAPDRATFFRLAPGETRTGANLSRVAVQTNEVRGTVTGIPPGWHRAAVSIALLSGLPLSFQAGLADTEGRFAFKAIPPGQYLITAWGPVIGSDEDGPVSGAGRRQGSRVINVTGADVEDIQVELRGPGLVTGKVMVEGASPGSRCYAGATVTLRPPDATLDRQEPRVVLTTENFRMDGVLSAHYSVEVDGLEEPCYLREVRVMGRSESATSIDIESDVGLQILLGTNGGTITGTVNGTDSSIVVLVRESGGVNTAAAGRAAYPDDKRNFRFGQVPPGRYHLMALRGLTSTDYLDPERWNDLGAIEITVEPGRSLNAELKVIR